MTEIMVLRLIHVVGGIFWVGWALIAGLFLGPVRGEAGPAAGQVMAGLAKPRFFVVLPLIAVLTMLSGFRLMWIVSDGFEVAYFATAHGAAFALSGTLALIAFLLGMFIARPAQVSIQRISAELGNVADEATRAELTQRLAGLRRRSVIMGNVLTVLLFLAAAGMAVSRYLG